MAEGHLTQPGDEVAGREWSGRKVTCSRILKVEAKKKNSDTRCMYRYFIHTGFESQRLKASEVPLPFLCKDLTKAK